MKTRVIKFFSARSAVFRYYVEQYLPELKEPMRHRAEGWHSWPDLGETIFETQIEAERVAKLLSEGRNAEGVGVVAEFGA